MHSNYLNLVKWSGDQLRCKHDTLYREKRKKDAKRYSRNTERYSRNTGREKFKEEMSQETQFQPLKVPMKWKIGVEILVLV